MKRLNYICKHCGSSDVIFDAYAQWNPESQEFVLYSISDDPWCCECGGETAVKTIDLAESNEGAAPCTD